MDVFQLLDEDQRYQLFILRFLDLAVDDYITISKLVELTGQSKFKITKFIQILNYDLNRFRDNCKIIIQDDLLTTENVDLTVIKLLQIDYFKSSPTFLLLIYLIEEGGTIEKYAADQFLSMSKAYAARRQLVLFLKSVGIKLKRNRLVGEEFSLRNTLSTVIFEAINGYYPPFASDINVFVKKVTEFLTYFYNLRLTPTQANKLEVLTDISLIRCKNNNSIAYSFFKDPDRFFHNVEKEIRYISNYMDVTPNALMEEFSYMSMFLFTEGFLEDAFSDKFNFDYFKVVDNESRELSDSILHQVEHSYNTKLSLEIFDTYTQRVKQTNRKRAIFSFETSSFFTNKQIQAVKELYPIYSEIIWRVIEEKHAHVSRDRLSRYFYDYLFILIDVIPPSQIENPIYVCVDFSQGTDYSNFIIKQIEGFKDLNLIIENRITTKTNILISNCVYMKFSGEQIIWKNPPTPSDWEFFGNAVIRTKRKLLFEDVSFDKGGMT